MRRVARLWIIITGLVALVLFLALDFLIPGNDKITRSSTTNEIHFYKWTDDLSDLSFEKIENQASLNIIESPLPSSDESKNILEPSSTHIPKQQIRQISLIGERNSGTNWIFSHLGLCFNHSLTVKRSLTRYKHWFQYENTTTFYPPNSTLVVAQFRDPYNWLMSMMHTPHHMPSHLRTGSNQNDPNSHGNDWKIFLTKVWTTPRTGIDLELMKQHPNDYRNLPCQEHFLFRDVVSCVKEPVPKANLTHEPRFSENQPFYEMRNDGTGLPYDNILEMRSDKILNFLSVAHYAQVAEFLPVQYEYLVEQGTAALLDRIAKLTGVQPKCNPDPPQKQRPVKASRVITPDFAKHIRTHLNWTIEAMIGYSPEPCYEARTCV